MTDSTPRAELHEFALHVDNAESKLESKLTDFARNCAFGVFNGSDNNPRILGKNPVSNAQSESDAFKLGLPQISLVTLNKVLAKAGLDEKPVITTNDGKITKIVYPKDAGVAEFSYDKYGISKVVRDGKPLMERLTEPRPDGECRWKLFSGDEVRGRLSIKDDGTMQFDAETAESYLFKPNGQYERIISVRDEKNQAAGERIDPMVQASFALDRDDPEKFVEWIQKNWNLFDKNKDGTITAHELTLAFGDKQVAKDADRFLTLLGSYGAIDFLGNKDGTISREEVEHFKSMGKDPELKEGLKRLAQSARDQLKTINHNLWGEFKNAADAIKSDAVSQGMIGDCWLMGSIAAVADRMPEKIEHMIKQNSDGGFTVTFPGLPDKPVTIEPPTLVEMAMYARGNKYGAWVAVLEKAAAKAINELLQKKQDLEIVALHGGDPAVALALLTGDQAPRMSTQDSNIEDRLNVAAQWGLPIVAGTKPVATDQNADERGVYFRHLYTAWYNPKTKEVTVRNPWGGQPLSEPSDPAGQPLDGVLDGKFKLSLEDFKRSFPDVWVSIP